MTTRTCPRCQGRGKVTVKVGPNVTRKIRCVVCNGTGRIKTRPR